VNVEILDDKLRGLTITPDRLRLDMAVGLYASDQITLGQGADIAGINQTRIALFSYCAAARSSRWGSARSPESVASTLSQ
jgi:hypothetical protein